MNWRLFLVLFCTLFAVRGITVPFALDEVQSTYVDDELEELWASLSNLYSPNIEDYQKIQNYLLNGKRPYLDVLFDYRRATTDEYPDGIDDRSVVYYSRLLQNIRMVGVNGEEPVFRQLALGGASREDRSKCIVLYGSYNMDTFDQRTPYVSRMLDIVADLEREGYVGHVMYRLGGYPLVDRGSLRLAHIPYSFKLLSLVEASMLGYEDVLWLDCSTHPVNNLEALFAELRMKGGILAATSHKVEVNP